MPRPLNADDERALRALHEQLGKAWGLLRSHADAIPYGHPDRTRLDEILGETTRPLEDWGEDEFTLRRRQKEEEAMRRDIEDNPPDLPF